ncbi:unnamed protein product [Caenorhabditis sp. 36 PRJEB53466]|nr:unnamed protein product [Caenorhabditis sp. 36 PRJEB53466]
MGARVKTEPKRVSPHTVEMSLCVKGDNSYLRNRMTEKGVNFARLARNPFKTVMQLSDKVATEAKAIRIFENYLVNFTFSMFKDGVEEFYVCQREYKLFESREENIVPAENGQAAPPVDGAARVNRRFPKKPIKNYATHPHCVITHSSLVKSELRQQMMENGLKGRRLALNPTNTDHLEPCTAFLQYVILAINDEKVRKRFKRFELDCDLIPYSGSRGPVQDCGCIVRKSRLAGQWRKELIKSGLSLRHLSVQKKSFDAIKKCEQIAMNVMREPTLAKWYRWNFHAPTTNKVEMIVTRMAHMYMTTKNNNNLPVEAKVDSVRNEIALLIVEIFEKQDYVCSLLRRLTL